MTIRECYAIIGDFDDVMSRIPMESMVGKFAIKFLDDKSYESLVKAIEEKNYEEAFRAAHTLKGVCQNLSLTGIFKYVYEITETFRDRQEHDVTELMNGLEAEYNKVIATINEYKASI